MGSKFYKLQTNEIHSITQIPKPTMFPNDSFPKEVREHINDNTNNHLTYNFSLFDRLIKFHFVIEDSNLEIQIEKYNKYVDIMLTWMYILNQYASKSCSKEITVYLYFTELLKKLPDTNIQILGSNHVNTAFTTTRPKVSEIVIFRKEEWFKVFMHETFHNFALDFSNMNNDECTKNILNIFPVKSDVNLYEAYAEFWAEIMNVCFCSFMEMSRNDDIHKNQQNIDNFIVHCEIFINFERTYSFFQMVKALGFMGLSYKDLYSMTPQSIILRENLYKEDSNILSYYVIKLVLLNNYQGFLSWCDTNNTSLLQFKQTTQNQKDFCTFIEKNYKNKPFLESVKCTERIINSVKVVKGQEKVKGQNKILLKNDQIDFILKNMRMSICELG